MLMIALIRTVILILALHEAASIYSKIGLAMTWATTTPGKAFTVDLSREIWLGPICAALFFMAPDLIRG